MDDVKIGTSVFFTNYYYFYVIADGDDVIPVYQWHVLVPCMVCHTATQTSDDNARHGVEPHSTLDGYANSSTIAACEYDFNCCMSSSVSVDIISKVSQEGLGMHFVIE